MKRSAGCLLLALLRVLPLAAVEQDEFVIEVPADKSEYFVIGLSTLEAVGLSTGNEYLTSSIPLLLEERIEAMESHDYSGEEQAAYRQKILKEAQRREARELAELRADKDELLFSSLTRRARREQAADYDARIEEAGLRVQALRGLAPEAIDFAGRKPVQIVTGTQSGRLLETPVFSPLGLARREGIDLLVWGLIEEVEEYLYLELHAYHAVLERELYSYRNAVRLEEINALVSEAAQGLAAVILGRTWAALAIAAEPEDVRFYIDGRFVGQGATELDYLEPGLVELRGLLPGYREELLRLELRPGERREVNLQLEAARAEMIFLVSDPPGAAVYEGSQWRGTTPLAISRPADQQRLLLRREGFLDFAIYLTPDTEDAVSVSLLDDSLDPVDLQKKRRTKFYTALGMFVLSLPIPYVSYSYAADYTAAYNQAVAVGADQDIRARLYDANQTFYSIYLGGLVVSASLFVNMMVNLIQYIRSADRNAG
jgi:hypothetical protein